MKLKHGKEIGVALLFLLAAVLLYFGMNYLKGINIFKQTKSYVAVFENANGLVEQGNVYIKGYKVGMVDRITYDFTKKEPFTIVFSTNKDIDLPEGTVVAMIADGLLGGEALEIRLPEEQSGRMLADGDTLPSLIEAGLIEGVVGGLTDKLDPVLTNLDSIMLVLKHNLTDAQMAALMTSLNATLAHADGITAKADRMMAGRIPMLVDSIQLVVNDFHKVSRNLAGTDFQATILKLDTTVNGVNQFVQKVNSTDGTIGMLLNDKDLYISLNNTVTSADSLLVDLKANPKRYVHFSLWGGKDDKDKKAKTTDKTAKTTK